MVGDGTVDDSEAIVSMKSGLEGRNNQDRGQVHGRETNVSMKSGLEGRNNIRNKPFSFVLVHSLNEVRPRRPEQFPFARRKQNHCGWSQ